MSNLTFVLPNKRSALFLKKYVREVSKGVSLMPRIMTINTFLGIYSDYPAANPRELLFVLYDAYRTVMQRRGHGQDARQFDSFVFWGDMMLNDFDDIDKSLVNADDIFRNLKNVKEIQADYLDEDQKEIISRIWGESRLTAHIEEFWLHIGTGNEHTLGEKFVFLWEILADIYHEFKATLKRYNRASEGEQYLMASKNVKNFDQYDFTGDTNYVFVGFNDLTAAETVVFDRFCKAGVAYFFWDTAPISLFDKGGCTTLPRPLQRLADLVRHFPMPKDYTVPLADKLPEISVTSVPSNVAQAKCVDCELKVLTTEKKLDPANAIETAIVLPDEGLILPTLLSIPEAISDLNISMGLSYHTTTFASLLHSIISMQLRARLIRGEYSFYYEDLQSVLSHPHIQAIAPKAADKVTAYVNGNKLYNAPASELCQKAPELSAVLTPVHRAATVGEVAGYLRNLLDWLGAGLKPGTDEKGKKKTRRFEFEAIKYFREELDKLTSLIERHKVEMSDHTFLHLFERIFTTRGLTLTGTPLQGLQILGVLETRALDFDNVIILSMNEGAFPRKQYSKTMIPSNLRRGYGLPDFDSTEWTYAYSFYRLISRAKRVALYYDSRSDGAGQGEKSRYISQLENLVPGIKISYYTLTTGAEAGDIHQFSVPKTYDVMAALSQYRGGGKKKFSASALKKYLECPFRFYLEYVRDMRDDDELTEGLSAAEIGTIVHNSIQSLYEGRSGQPIDAPLIDSWLDPANTVITDTVAEQIRKVHFTGNKVITTSDFTPEFQIAAKNLEVLIRSNLEAEREAYCNGRSFIFIENEYKVNTLEDGTVWTLEPGLEINFYMAIDRVDQIEPGLLRFIDFKTGTEDTTIENLANIFTNYNHKKSGIFQLLLYCEAYLSLCNNGTVTDIQPILHPLRQLAAATPIKPMSVEKEPLLSYLSKRDTFRPLLINLIKEIFNPEVPFVQCSKTDSCKYCPFLSLCARNVKKY